MSEVREDTTVTYYATVNGITTVLTGNDVRRALNEGARVVRYIRYQKVTAEVLEAPSD